jgi:hypothetical protein
MPLLLATSCEPLGRFMGGRWVGIGDANGSGREGRAVGVRRAKGATLHLAHRVSSRRLTHHRGFVALDQRGGISLSRTSVFGHSLPHAATCVREDLQRVRLARQEPTGKRLQKGDVIDSVPVSEFLNGVEQ